MTGRESNQVPKFVQAFSALANYPRVLANPLLGVFRPFDKTVLGLLRDGLSAEDAEILDAQLVEVNFAQCVTARISEISLVKLKPLSSSHERARYFVRAQDPFVLAKMQILVDDKKKCTCRANVSRGVLRSIDFSIDIRPFRESTNVKLVSLELGTDSHILGTEFNRP